MSDASTELAGREIWSPKPDVRSTSQVGAYMDWLEAERGLAFADYHALHHWSVTDIEGFWQSMWDYFGIEATESPTAVLGDRGLPDAAPFRNVEWFPGARLNYAQHIVGGRFDDDKVAVLGRSQTRDGVELTYGELTEQVARARVGLQRLGVGKGDRVVAYLPNIPETLVAYLATTSLGAIWASCASEFGSRSVIDRFGQIEPKVLLAVSGYTYGDKPIDRGDNVAEILAGLPTVEHVVEVPYGIEGKGSSPLPELDAPTVAWADLLAEHAPLEFEPVPFDHPLVVLFSSGTTGLPKAIIHGHGGILLEHIKNHVLSWDFTPDDRLMWFSTTAWMIWNASMSSLLVGTSVVMLDGNPMWPDLDGQWALAAETETTVLGLSPGYTMACRKAGMSPTTTHDLSRVREICSAGSPLPPEGALWLVETFGPDVLLNNGSGGTDVCSGMVQGNPLLPVYAGEMSGRCLGVATAAYDPDGNEVVGELGEMVITQPMPSMPVGFWGDDSGARYQGAYFGDYPGVWRQGDWIRFDERGSSVITGRSDATLNRGGVRLGTAEFYRVVEELPEITDALVVHIEDPSGGLGRLVLFVVTADGAALDDDLRRRIAVDLRTALSPRHIPDEIIEMPGVPRSLTGKRLELPVKKMMQGVDPTKVASRDALADPAILDAYADWVTP
ncbi:MAG: acetoacetate--CoA ligase [Acidimicrobiales bacterium]